MKVSLAPKETSNKKDVTSSGSSDKLKINKIDKFQNLLSKELSNIEGEDKSSPKLKSVKPQDLISLKNSIKSLKEIKTEEKKDLSISNIEVKESDNSETDIITFKQAQNEFQKLKENGGNEIFKEKATTKENKSFVIKFKNFKSVEVNIEVIKQPSVELKTNTVHFDTYVKETIPNTLNTVQTTIKDIILNKNIIAIDKNQNKREKTSKVTNNKFQDTKIYSDTVKDSKQIINNASKSKEQLKEVKTEHVLTQNVEQKQEYKNIEAKLILIKMNKNELQEKIQDNISKIVEHKMALPLTNIKIKLNNNETVHLKFSGNKEKANLDIKTSDVDIAKEISKVKENLSSNIENVSNIKNIDISVVYDKKETIEKYLYMINKEERDKNGQGQGQNQPQEQVETEQEDKDEA